MVLFWVIILVVSLFSSMAKNSYSLSVDSENICNLNPSNFGARAIKFYSNLEQFMSPVIAGKNSVFIMSSSQALKFNRSNYLGPAEVP